MPASNVPRHIPFVLLARSGEPPYSTDGKALPSVKAFYNYAFVLSAIPKDQRFLYVVQRNARNGHLVILEAVDRRVGGKLLDPVYLPAGPGSWISTFHDGPVNVYGTRERLRDPYVVLNRVMPGRGDEAPRTGGGNSLIAFTTRPNPDGTTSIYFDPAGWIDTGTADSSPYRHLYVFYATEAEAVKIDHQACSGVERDGARAVLPAKWSSSASGTSTPGYATPEKPFLLAITESEVTTHELFRLATAPTSPTP